MKNASILLATYGKFLDIEISETRLFLDSMIFIIHATNQCPMYAFTWNNGIYSRVLFVNFHELYDDISYHGKEELLSHGTHFLQKLNELESAVFAKDYLKNTPEGISQEEWTRLSSLLIYFFKTNQSEYYLDEDRLHALMSKTASLQGFTKSKVRKAVDKFSIYMVHNT